MEHLTVQQLIEKLQQYEDSLIVLIPGYETGYSAATDFTETTVTKVDNPSWWDGAYEESEIGHKALILR